MAFYQEWGWFDFLDAVAKAGIFTIQGSGLTAIDCAKLAKAYDVLIWASKEKDYSHAWNHAHKK
jgi:hypothetical protein